MPGEITFGILFCAVISLLTSGCNKRKEISPMKEIQLTTEKFGHTLNSTQVFSPDDQWIVYDTRNEDAHISRTATIEKVHIETGEVVTIYSTENQAIAAPVGGALWSYNGETLVFNRYVGVGDDRFLQIIKLNLK
jgi:hypothetical protein